jgi:drug/metabolite transporter (DMT)-like permease
LIIVLALAAALGYGAADFLGGIATKRAATLSVVVLSQVVGVLTVCVVAGALPAAHPQPVDLVWGATAGLIGGSGLALFYRALSRGSMTVIAPVTAVVAIAVPVIVGLVRGERPIFHQLLGIGLAVVSIGLVSATVTRGEDGGRPRIRGAISASEFAGALAAGACFGGFLAVIREASPAAGIWPLAAGRAASILAYIVGAVLVRRPLPFRAPRGAWPAIVGAGVLDMSANICYLLATHRGMLAIVATLASLYPVTTVLLARVVLHERIAPQRGLGLALAASAVVLVSTG